MKVSAHRWRLTVWLVALLAPVATALAQPASTGDGVRFPDTAALTREEDRRWELTVNPWDLPIHRIDPHAAQD